MASPSEMKVFASSSVGTGSVTIIEWEDLEQELARLWSLSSALNKAKEKKEVLAQKLQSFIQFAG